MIATVISFVIAMLVMATPVLAAPAPTAAMASAATGAGNSSSSGGLSPKVAAILVCVFVAVAAFVIWAFGTLRYGRWTLFPAVWEERNPQDVEDYEEEFDRAKALRPVHLCGNVLFRVLRPRAYKAEQEAIRRKLDATKERELKAFLAKADAPSLPSAPAPAARKSVRFASPPTTVSIRAIRPSHPRHLATRTTRVRALFASAICIHSY